MLIGYTMLKNIAIFMLGLAVALENGVALCVSAVMAMLSLIRDKERFSNVFNKNFDKTVVLFFSYIVLISLYPLINSDYASLKMIIRNFEKVVSFIIIYLLIGNMKQSFYYGSLGFIIGILCGELSVIFSFVNKESIGLNRYGGIYGHPNSLGTVIELAIPFLLFSLYKHKTIIKYKIITILAIIGACFALIASGSRGAFLAVIGEVGVLVAIFLYRRFSICSLKQYTMVAISAIFACLLAYVKCSPRNYDFERMLLWQSSWKMFLDHPIFGVGYSNWKTFYQMVYMSPFAQEPNLPHCHNLYLHLLSTTGLIGIFAFFLFIYGIAKIAVEYSVLEYKLFKKALNISDMFLAVICGMLIHGVVDMNAILRFYLLKFFFFWALCCMRYKEIDIQKI